jgi:hypothetical protein
MVIIGRNPKTVLSVMSTLPVDGKTDGRGNGVSKLIMVYCYSESYLYVKFTLIDTIPNFSLQVSRPSA